MLFLLLQIAWACNEKCAFSCKLFNGLETCYEACDCKAEKNFFFPSEIVLENYGKIESEMLENTECYLADFEICKENVRFSQYYECLRQAKCLFFTDFYALTSKVPMNLYMAIRPTMLTTYINTEKELEIYKEFYDCQRICNVEDFKSINQCLEVCVLKLEKEKEKCESYCIEKCLDGLCFSQCFCENKPDFLLLNPGLKGKVPKTPLACPVDRPEFKIPLNFVNN